MKNKWQQVRLCQRIYARCPVTGKRRRRFKTFRQYLDPLNTDADGRPKTRSQILDELIEEAVDWKPACACVDCAAAQIDQAAISDDNLSRPPPFVPSRRRVE
jgi:hypothetical protein